MRKYFGQVGKLKENKIFSKFNLKNYNDELEEILETKVFSFDVKNLLLSIFIEILSSKKYEFLSIEKSLIEKQAVAISALQEENKELKAVLQNTMVYDYVDKNMPPWARPAVQAAMDCGAVQGDENGRLELSYKDLRAICREYRCGLYNK